jgi:hypothetical protein
LAVRTSDAERERIRGLPATRPVWIAGQGAAANGKRYGHAVVVSGMWGDGDAHGSTTLLRIHDPWPGPRGRVYDTYFFGRKASACRAVSVPARRGDGSMIDIDAL